MKKSPAKQEDLTAAPYGGLKFFGPKWRITVLFIAAFTLFFLVATLTLVILTKSSKEVRVPDVVGKKFIDVYNILSRKEMRPSIIFKDVADLDDGIVIAQHPQSGTVVKSDTRIRLTVSRSSYFVETPNLVGLAYPIALNKMKNLQYQGRPVSVQRGTVSFIPSKTSAVNIVMGQSPSAGERITPDQKINLLVSAGDVEGNNTMPELEGQSIDLAYDLLLSKGVIVRQVIVKTADKKQSGLITAQQPAQGTVLAKKSVVTLTVNWFPLTDHPYTAYERVEFAIPGDQKKGFYEAFIQDGLSRRIRYASDNGPGGTVDFIFKRTGNARIEIVNDRKPVKVKTINVE